MKEKSLADMSYEELKEKLLKVEPIDVTVKRNDSEFEFLDINYENE